MSGLFSGKKTQTSEVKLPKYIEKGGAKIFRRAENLAYNKPYKVYEGQRVADQTGTEEWARWKAGQNVNATAPGYINSTISDASRFMTNPGDEINAFMNPFEDSVVNQVMADMSRVRDIDTQKLASAKALGGAYGGARHGVQDAEQSRDYYDRLGANLSNLRRQGYLDAYGMASESQGRRLDAARTGTDYFRTTQDVNQQAVRDLSGMGADQRAVHQARLDRQAADWEKLYNMPFERLNFLTGTLQGIPYGESQTTTSKDRPSILELAGKAAGAVF